MLDNLTHPWKKINPAPRACDHWRTGLLRALRSPNLPASALAFPIPQNDCCFRFGTAKQPLPAGALLRLWNQDPYATGLCPKCGGEAVATAFGGMLSIGGYKGQCLACGIHVFHQMGGITVVQQHVRPFLEGSPWYLNGMIFGGAAASDGKALIKSLSLPKPPKSIRRAEPSLKIGKKRLPAMDVNQEGTLSS